MCCSSQVARRYPPKHRSLCRRSSKIDIHVSNLQSREFCFLRGSGPPLRLRKNWIWNRVSSDERWLSTNKIQIFPLDNILTSRADSKQKQKQKLIFYQSHSSMSRTKCLIVSFVLGCTVGFFLVVFRKTDLVTFWS